jgi:tellurite resistance protein TehA-like permease
VLNFAPSWFSVNMGTGIVSILLQNLPFNAIWIYWISVAIFVLNVFLFVVFMLISLVRYSFFPGLWRCMIRHPAESLFLGEHQDAFVDELQFDVLIWT